MTTKVYGAIEHIPLSVTIQERKDVGWKDLQHEEDGVQAIIYEKKNELMKGTR